QKDGGANACWDGTNAAGHFTAACPNYVTATGTTSWSTTLGSAALVDGSSYALTVQTIDNATNANTNNSAASSSFVYDNTAPTLSSLATNAAGTSLTLTYNESLDTGSTPAAGDFTLEYQSSLGGSWASKSISGVSVSGSTVVLTISTAPNDAQNIRLSYTSGTNKTRDLAANSAANFSQ